MREILFRGKRIGKNEWVKGDLIHLPNGIAILANGYAYVIPETVGQYTGLKDKKGKMIFEGDILIDKYSNEKFGFVGVVKYNENLTKFQIVSDKYPNYDVGVGSRRDSIKILGNAYDNPELLEAKS